jgi:lysophospholipase L1-like esterase
MDVNQGNAMPTTTKMTLPGVSQRPRLGLAVAILLMIGGTLLLAVAAQRDRLWWLLLWFFLGIVALATSLLYVNDRMDERLQPLSSVPRPWWSWSTALSLVSGFVLGAVVVAEGNVWVAACCVLGLVIGLIALHVALSQGIPPTPSAGTPWWAAIGWKSQVGAVAMLACTFLVALSDGFGWPEWILVVVWIFGLVLLKIGVVPYLRSKRERIRSTMWALIGLTMLGFLLLVVGATSASELLLLLGMTLVIGALSVLGLAAVHCRCSPARASWMIGVGAAMIVIGTRWVILVVNGWQLGVVVAAFVWGIGTWYIFRGEGIVLVLLIGFVAVWGLVDRTAAADADPHRDGEVRMLALGDSFISGEGAKEFLDGTNDVGDDRNECRRAATAYPYLVADELGYSLAFVACQGAKMRDLTRCAQMLPDEAKRCRGSEADWAAEVGTLRHQPPGNLPQLVNFTEHEYKNFDVVVLSISGNDSGFSTIVKSCLLPEDCSALKDTWNAKVARNRTELRELYRRIRGLVRPDTPVIVMPYPRMVSGTACGLGLSGAEHEFVEQFIEQLDREIKQAATDAGVNFFEYSLESFDGNQLCDVEKGANHLRLEPTEGDWADRYQPQNWIHGSMHPNELGHRRIADRLTPYVEELLADVGSGEPANPPTVMFDGEPANGDPLTAAEEDLADEAEQLLANGEWITDDLYDTVRDLAVPLFVLLAGGVVFAAGLVRKDFWLANALRPRDAQP